MFIRESSVKKIKVKDTSQDLKNWTCRAVNPKRVCLLKSLIRSAWPRNDLLWTNGRLDACQDMCVSVCFMFGFQTWSPCNMPQPPWCKQTKYPGPKKGDTLIGIWGYWKKLEFRKSEKSGKIPKISGFWYFFQILKIQLLSTLTGHAKCRHFSRQGTHIHVCTVL